MCARMLVRCTFIYLHTSTHGSRQTLKPACRYELDVRVYVSMIVHIKVTACYE